MREKTYSDEVPENQFKILIHENSFSSILFYDNVEEIIDENGNITYCSDLYTLDNIIYRENLAEQILNNFETWLELAKNSDYNKVAKEVRIKRDKLLAATDWTQMPDTALTPEEVEKYTLYRQELRDIPQQEGFPYDVVWPTLE